MLRGIPAGAPLLRRPVFRTFLSCVLQPLPDGGLFLRPLFRCLLRFLPAAAVVDNPVDHAVVAVSYTHLDVYKRQDNWNSQNQRHRNING